MSTPVQVPADVNRPDLVLGRLTARQVAVLAGTAAAVYTLWTLLAPNLVAFVVVAAPFVVGGLVLAFVRRHGLPVDQLLGAAARQYLDLRGTPRLDTPRRGMTGRDMTASGMTGRAGTGRGEAAATVGAGRVLAARVPLRGIRTSGPDGLGVLDLGEDGVAVVCAVTPLNLALRSPHEVDAAVGGFARWLVSLTAPVQIVTRTRPLDLRHQVAALRHDAGFLPHPALAGAASAHAEHLAALGHDSQLLGHDFLLVFRDRTPARKNKAAAAAVETLRRRAAEARALLDPIGLRITGLPSAEAAAVLRRATIPSDRPGTNPGGGGGGRVDLDGPTVELELAPAPDRRGRLWGRVGAPTRQRVRRTPTVQRGSAVRHGSAVGDRRGWFDPESVTVGPARVRVGQMWSQTLVVTGFPHLVAGAGWLAPIIGHPGLADVSVHLTPIPAEVAATRLRRQLTRLEAGRRSDAGRGRLPDPDVDAAAEDAQDLADRVARGDTRLFSTTVTVTVSAPTPEQLDDELAAVGSVLASLMITTHPARWRAWHGWQTGLPLGLDRIGSGRTLDTGSVAAMFPFASPDLPLPDPSTGVLFGDNLASSSLVFWDRWAADNHNATILGSSGAGKSYLAKLELLRSLYTGAQAHVIDPEHEYAPLAETVGGSVIRVGTAGVRINPFDLHLHTGPDGRPSAAPDELTRRRLLLHTFLTVALSTGTDDPTTSDGAGSMGLTALERAVLDEAITATYTGAGITTDPRTWTRPAPTLRDLHTTLTRHARGHDHSHEPSGNISAGLITRALDPEHETPDPGAPDPGTPAPGADAQTTDPAAGAGPHDSDPAPRSADPREDDLDSGGARAAGDVARRLRPYIDGAFAGVFDGPSTPAAGGAHLVVWSLRDLPEAQRSLAMLLVLDTIWRTVTHPHHRRRRMILVDEAWLMLQHRASARFLLRAAKAGRKHWCGLTVITQDATDVLASDLGRSVITNSATQILLRQAPQAIEDVARVFGLSAGERALLMGADRGDGLVTGSGLRAAFTALASPAEDAVITTDPAQLAGRPGDDDWITLDATPEPAHSDPTQAHPAQAHPVEAHAEREDAGPWPDPSGPSGQVPSGLEW